MKKIVTLGFALLMGISLMANGKSEEGSTTVAVDNFNASGLPIVKEQVTLSIATKISEGDHSNDDVILHHDLEEMTNIDIEWIEINGKSWNERKGLMFASNDLPDGMLGAGVLENADLLKYGNQGLILPISDYFDFTSNFNTVMSEDPSIKPAITAPNGKVYAFPSLPGMDIGTDAPMYINKEWLDKVGMDVPTTTDEYVAVLKAFRDQDPNGNGKNDEIPMTFKNNFTDLFGAFGCVDFMSDWGCEDHIRVEGDKVVYTAVEEEYKNALKWFNMLFEEGLMDPESFTQDNSVFSGKIKAETRIAGSFQGWRSTTWKRTPEDEDYVPMGPLAGPGGDKNWQPKPYFIAKKGSGVITQECDQPEVMARWFDMMYDQEFALQISMQYYLGKHVIEENGMYKVIATPSRMDAEDTIHFTRHARISGMTAATGAKLDPPPTHILEKWMLDEYYAPYQDRSLIYPNVFFSEMDTRRLTELKAEVVAYTNEMHARWIMQGGIDEDWDNYLMELRKRGLEEMLEIYQKGLDDFNSIE